MSLPASTRSRSPSHTVELMRPYFPELGITRIARQTGLDRIGLPCFASIRPDSRTLAVNQGKGLTDDEARASAVMEAVEFAVAERPRVKAIMATARSLMEAGENVYLARDLMPLGRPLDPDRPIRWVEGRGLLDQALVWVPLAVVTLGDMSSDLPGICHTTNGLASGNTLTEAVQHGLCELIERDATTLWYLAGPDSMAGSCIDPAALGSQAVDALIDRIEAGGLAVRLFEQTCDTGISVIMAVIAMFGGAGHHFDICSGYAASPDPVHAALRALCEASQSRITTIASARDDIDPALFGQKLDQAGFDLFRDQMPARAPSACSAPPCSGEETVRHIALHLAAIGIDQPIVVDLGGMDMPCRIVRVLGPEMEAMGANTNWRPGRRAAGVAF